MTIIFNWSDIHHSPLGGSRHLTWYARINRHAIPGIAKQFDLIRWHSSRYMHSKIWPPRMPQSFRYPFTTWRPAQITTASNFIPVYFY